MDEVQRQVFREYEEMRVAESFVQYQELVGRSEVKICVVHYHDRGRFLFQQRHDVRFAESVVDGVGFVVLQYMFYTKSCNVLIISYYKVCQRGDALFTSYL